MWRCWRNTPIAIAIRDPQGFENSAGLFILALSQISIRRLDLTLTPINKQIDQRRVPLPAELSVPSPVDLFTTGEG